MREKFIKFGAYLILICGIILFLAFVGFSIYLFTAYPYTSMQKKALVGAAVLIMGVVELIIIISIFEAMIETAHLEAKEESKGPKEIENG